MLAHDCNGPLQTSRMGLTVGEAPQEVRPEYIALQCPVWVPVLLRPQVYVLEGPGGLVHAAGRR
jgi:hypothetical protein